jgi:hypothetical protein
MVDTEMPLLGEDYYVLAAAAGQIDILDSAEKTSIDEGETATVKGKSVEIAHIESGEVRLSIDGVTTDKLAEHEYEELDDGSYVVITAVDYVSKETGISSVEFSIGNGKMELINNSEIEVNDEDVDGLEAVITDDTGLSKITITWKSDRETYLTEDDSIAMPAFEAISLVYEGLDYPAESEVISFENGETFTIQMDNYELPLMWYDDSTGAALGEEDNLLVLATSTATNTTWTVPPRTANLTSGLDLAEDNRFLVTLVDTDLSDIQTMYYEVNTIENDSGDILVELEDLIGDSDVTFDAIESDDVGDITITLEGVNGSVSGARAYLNFSESTAGTLAYNVAVSDLGLKLELGTDADYATNGTGYTITMTEANNDEDVGSGYAFTATVKNTTNNKLHVSTQNLSTEEEADDVDIGVVPSDLASKFTIDSSADEYDYEVEYFGKEVTATVNVVAGADVEGVSDSAVGSLVVMDDEVDSVSSKNLIIVGGSCINSAAATALGVPTNTCGAAFTAATGVGTGQFLIKAVDGAFASGKIALVVAGYETADTVAAATYLMTKTVDTSSVDEVYTSSTMEAVMA